MSASDQANPAAPESTPDTEDGYEFSEQIGYLLRRAYQRHLAIFQEHSADPQLTSTQFVTLCALRDHGASPQSELIRATGIDQATIRGIIDRLGKRELIAFRSDPGDRRKVILELTATGRAVLARMVPRARMISELTMGALNPAERAAVVFTLRKMIDS